VDFHTKKEISYKTLFESSCRLAYSLQKTGYKQNDVISVCSENSLQFFYPVIAALYTGIIIAPLNIDYSKGELFNALNISKPKLIFCSKKTLSKIVRIKVKFTCIKQLIVLDATEDINGNESFPNFILRNYNFDFDTKDYQPLDFNSNEQVAAIMFSSGTTGLPKGVMTTHKNLSVLFAHSKDNAATIQNIPGTTALSVLPHFHNFGFVTTLRYFLTGIRIVMLPRFEPEPFLRSIEEYETYSVIVVPSVLIFLAKSSLVNKYNLSSLKEIICGAAPIGREIIEAASKRLKLSGIRQGYGMTETTVTIKDVESSKALGPYQRGEICIKGDAVMKGYVDNEKATKEMIDDNGWLHTGDLGYYDRDAYFYIVDRIKELIKYKGFQIQRKHMQVPPAEIEELLLRHSKIKDAAVVGISDKLAGELPAAFVVVQPGENVTAKQIFDYIAGQVSPAKHLRGGVRFVKEISKNPSGKILRKVLREMVANVQSKL
ncbi:hypothetical protein ILUMI_27555, partial [Ignelater luminosus]